MKLTVGERLLALDLLPKEGSYATLRLVRQTRELLSFSQEEIERFRLTETPIENGMKVSWDTTKDEAVDFDLPNIIKEMLAKALKQRDKDGGLTEALLPLYEKFVPLEDR